MHVTAIPAIKHSVEATPLSLVSLGAFMKQRGAPIVFAIRGRDDYEQVKRLGVSAPTVGMGAMGKSTLRTNEE
jgi:hypothetical protein